MKIETFIYLAERQAGMQSKGDGAKRAYVPPYPNTPTNGEVFSMLLNPSNKNLARRLYPFYEPILAGLEEKIVVDLGCGYGSTFIYMLKEHGRTPKQTIHLDANKAVFPRDTGEPNADRTLLYDWSGDGKAVADAMQLPFRDGSIDIVHTDYLFADNGYVDETRAIGEIRRVLKPGGLFINTEFSSFDLKGFEKVPYDINHWGIYRK